MTDKYCAYCVLAAFLPSQTIEILGKLSDVERCALARVSNNGPANLDNLPAHMMRVVERCADYAVNMTSRPASVVRAYDRLRENADRLGSILDGQESAMSPENLELFLSAYRYAIRLCGWTLAECDEDGEADMFGYEHLGMDDVTLASQITEVRKITAHVDSYLDPAFAAFAPFYTERDPPRPPRSSWPRRPRPPHRSLPRLHRPAQRQRGRESVDRARVRLFTLRRRRARRGRRAVHLRRVLRNKAPLVGKLPLGHEHDGRK